MKKQIPEYKRMIRIGQVEVSSNFFHYYTAGHTQEARMSVLAALSESQRKWLLGRPWEARPGIYAKTAVVYARMGKHGNFDREELMAKLLFND